MPRKQSAPPALITLRHLVPHYYPPDGRDRWHARLPNGQLVFLGRTEDEVRANLDTLNRIAHLCCNRWRGVRAITFDTS